MYINIYKYIYIYIYIHIYNYYDKWFIFSYILDLVSGLDMDLVLSFFSVRDYK